MEDAEQGTGYVNRFRLAFALGAVVAAAVLAGCSSPGQPQPTSPPAASGTDSASTGTGSTAPGSVSTEGAPTVSHPLDAQAILADPCSALTAGQLSALGVGGSAPMNNSDPTGPGCGWTSQSLLTVGVKSLAANTHGLSDLYRKQQSMAYWRPTQVDGYPAVFADAAPQQNGGCLLNTAVNDHLYFLASADGAASNDQACLLARQTAADVIKNLGGS